MPGIWHGPPFRPVSAYRRVLDGTIAIDATSSSAYQASVSSYSWSHTCAGSNRVLIVAVSVFASGTVSGITYNGVSLTFVRADTNGLYRTEVWRLVAPATGSNTIAVTLSASLTSIANAASYTGVDQATPISANAGNTGTNTPATDAITPGEIHDWVVHAISTSDTAITVGDGQRQRANNTGALGTGALADAGSINPATSQTARWDGIGTLDTWAMSAVSLKPNLGVLVNITGAVVGVARAQGALVGTGTLTGRVAGISFAKGGLIIYVPITGTAAGISKSQGGLGGTGRLTGTAEGISRSQGGLLGAASLTGTAKGIARSQGTILGAGAVSGTAKGISRTQGALSGTGGLTGRASGLSFLQGRLLGSGTLSGTAVGLSLLKGIIGAGSGLTGTAIGIGILSGTISATGTMTVRAAGIAMTPLASLVNAGPTPPTGAGNEVIYDLAANCIHSKAGIQFVGKLR